MKAIFLDVDGVLNDRVYRESTDNYYENPIDEKKLELLRCITYTDAIIVLTSTWRMYWNEGEIQFQEEGKKLNEIFEKHGLEIYSKTENFGEDRDYEILMWLAKNKVDSYVILDDIDFGWSEQNRKRFVKTDDETGLDEKTAEKAICVLMNGCYADITTVDDKWAEVQRLLSLEEDNIWFKDVNVKGYFVDSNMLLLSAHSFIRTVIEESEELCDALDKAIRTVFGEEIIEYLIEDEDIEERKDDADDNLQKHKIIYDPFAVYNDKPDLKMFKVRERVKKLLREHPERIFKSENIYGELLFRLLLIFVNAHELCGITDQIKVSRIKNYIEIYSNDYVELLIDKLSTEKQIFCNCDYEKYVIRNYDKSRRYLPAPFHIKSSVKSRAGEEDFYVNVDVWFTIFSLVNMRKDVRISSVKDGNYKSVKYEDGINFNGVETGVCDRKNGTYIVFEAPEKDSLSNDEICNILKTISLISGLKINFFDPENGDWLKYDYKNIGHYLDKRIKAKCRSSYVGKLKAGGRDRFDKDYYNAKVEFAFNFTEESNITKTYYNYSLLPQKNVFSEKICGELTKRLNDWLGEKTSRGKFTNDYVRKFTSYIISIKTDGDLIEFSPERKDSPKYRRMIDDMIEVILDEGFSYWLKENEEVIVKMAFDIFDKRDGEIKEGMFPDGMK